jgi:hypothetical protein
MKASIDNKSPHPEIIQELNLKENFIGDFKIGKYLVSRKFIDGYGNQIKLFCTKIKT